MMVVAHNLWLAGWCVHVFGDHAHALAAWFPHLRIAPLPEQTIASFALQSFEFVIQQHRDSPLKNFETWHKGFLDLHDVEYADSGLCMAERFAKFTAARFGLKNAEVSTGIRPRPGLVFRKYATRVALHPAASSGDKRWLPSRFVDVARRLRAVDLSVEFTMLASERTAWVRAVGNSFPTRHFESTAELAEWLYESGWFIGNDSGVGHLASSLCIPTLTIFRRRRVSQRWRPGFAAAAVVVPPWWLPTAALKERFWRESISVRRVLKAFSRLRSKRFPSVDSNVCEIAKL